MFKISWHELYCHPLPELHRFPMEKYNLLPQQLMHEGVISISQLICPIAVKDDIILLTHTEDYLNKLNHFWEKFYHWKSFYRNWGSTGFSFLVPKLCF